VLVEGKLTSHCSRVADTSRGPLAAVADGEGRPRGGAVGRQGQELHETRTVSFVGFRCSVVRATAGFVGDELGVPADRVYLTFSELAPTDWAWKGNTFG
jgi:hypothetical protein